MPAPTEARRRSSYAHVLRRTTFGPFPGQVERALDDHPTIDELVDARLAADPLPFVPMIEDPTLPNGGLIDIDDQGPENDLRLFHRFREWWLNRMRSDDAGLHERMMWFWHTLFTTHCDAVNDNNLCWRQLRTIHEHALGNVGDLARAMTVDGAMLVNLGGNNSAAPYPNENYARELMELFLLGIGQYTQEDVRAVALACAGWRVNRDPTAAPTPRAVVFDPEKAHHGRVRLFGRRRRLDASSVIDVILDRDACAPYLVGKIWTFLGGGSPPDEADAWARSFRRSGYEVLPLLDRMLHSDALLASHGRRLRTPIEWYCAVCRVADLGLRGLDGLAELGQVPYHPPSVAGWPGDRTWSAPAHLRARERFVTTRALPAAAQLAGAPDLVSAVADRCELDHEDTGCRERLRAFDEQLRSRSLTPEQRAASLLTLAVLMPEFSVA